MKRHIKKLITKVAPGLAEDRMRLRSVEQKLDTIIGRLDALEQRDTRLDRLKALLGEVEHYQPTYHLSGLVDTPARTSHDRCIAIEAALRPLPGKRWLDIGSSLGYVSFYLADRGCHVQGWEENVKNAEAARLIGDLNGIKVDFRTKEFNDKTVGTIQPGEFDVATVLSVFHHIIRFNGLEYTQQLVKELMERVPVMVVELAKKGEDPKLPWDASQPEDELAIFDLVKDRVDIQKIGDFGNHLSSKTRPLYIVRLKKVLSMNGKNYAYDSVENVAYKDSVVGYHAVQRRYYYGQNFVIKEYALKKGLPKDTVGQILNEIQLLTNLADKKVHHLPHLIDFEIAADYVRVMLERQEGTLLHETPALSESALKKYLKDVTRTIEDLHQLGINHNDIRPWNIIVNKAGAWLIDYGLSGALRQEDDIASLLDTFAKVEHGEASVWNSRAADRQAAVKRLPESWGLKGIKGDTKAGDILKQLG